jgi:diphthine synthase
MLYFIGLGLSDEKDITIAGLEIVKSSSRVYLEAYTSILMIEKEKLVLPFRSLLQRHQFFDTKVR